jgi:hypothetical protein
MGGTAALLARGADNGDQRFVGIGLDHARCADPRPARAYPALHARRERISLVHGLRSVSRVHRNKPYVFGAGHRNIAWITCPAKAPATSWRQLHWRGPIWFPINYLNIEALERYHHFYGNKLKVECPVGSGKMLTLQEVAQELSRRLSSIFLPDENGERPCHGSPCSRAPCRMRTLEC